MALCPPSEVAVGSEAAPLDTESEFHGHSISVVVNDSDHVAVDGSESEGKQELEGGDVKDTDKGDVSVDASASGGHGHGHGHGVNMDAFKQKLHELSMALANAEMRATLAEKQVCEKQYYSIQIKSLVRVFICMFVMDTPGQLMLVK